MFYKLFETLFLKLSTVTLENWNSQQEFINARLAIRDRLKREARLNAELLDKMKGNDLIIDELSTSALQEVFEMPIPLTLIMDKSLSVSSKGILNKVKAFKNWTQNIDTEAELLERLWQRTRMLQINTKYKQVKPNVRYLFILNKALVDSISSKEGMT
jgi:hypothetical protein